MRLKIGALLILCLGLAATAFAADAAGYLRWNIEKDSENQVSRRSVSWIDTKGHVAWTKKLPEPLGESICCWDKDAIKYKYNPATSDYAKDWQPVIHNGALMFEEEGALLVLSQESGKERFLLRLKDDSCDKVYDSLIIDDGSIEIRRGAESCKSDVGASFVRACGDILVLYDKCTIATIDAKTYKVLHKQLVKGTAQDCKKPKQKVDREVKAGDTTIHFQGERISQCIN